MNISGLIFQTLSYANIDKKKKTKKDQTHHNETKVSSIS